MYTERVVAGLGVLWRVEQPAAPAALAPGAPLDLRSTIVPADGCADFVLRGDELHVAGPSTTWMRTQLDLHGPTVGLRFAPGTAAAALRRPVADLRDVLVPAADAVDAAVARRVAAALRAIASRSSAHATGRIAGGRSTPAGTSARVADDDRVHAIARATGAAGPIACSSEGWARMVLRAADRAESLGAIAFRLGWSERHLHRKMLAEFGYGYAALRRLRRGLRARAAMHSGAALALVAEQAGYSDQSHFTREFARLNGESPAAYLRSRQTGGRSESGDAESGA
ncbi:helix-turn-helix domain-containing protein [Leucobacter chromiiresistens]|uniref:AraC-type DNA-binding protein n=3 Tax=Leucobacter chromiiresistens TaxID=1079994 RepID=A0A1H0ZUF2_9MICO|nr:AraC family transcriptional regulator [Leucobacter chromiiresistens]SDQ31043.1 AraC-type DNA-binding protein [Leucobacter chromiiresistens]